MNGKRDEPLKDEAARRKEWRHTLPANGDDDEKTSGGRGGGSSGFGTILPPD